jgi:hypothetical protein
MQHIAAAAAAGEEASEGAGTCVGRAHEALSMSTPTHTSSKQASPGAAAAAAGRAGAAALGVEGAAALGGGGGGADAAGLGAAAAPPAASAAVKPANAATWSASSTSTAAGVPMGTSLLPPGTRMAATKPSSCASHEMVALSVSTSHSTSPGATESPTWQSGRPADQGTQRADSQ